MNITNTRYRELLKRERVFTDIKYLLVMEEAKNSEERMKEKHLLDHIKWLIQVESEGEQ